MSLFSELKRRNVIRVALAYAVASWLLMQIVEMAADVFAAPDWVMKMIMTVLAIGVLPVLVFSWAYELTPEGVRKESEIPRDESVTAHTAKKLDIAVIVLIVAAMAMLGLDRLLPEDSSTNIADPVESSADAPPELATDLSVAVLPFVNMSTDAENEFFADGISEEILNLLAGVRDLEVASRTSAFAFKESGSSIPEIASQLGVRYVLEGSVRKAGAKVRITAQLIDAQNDRHLWSDTFDRTLEDIFAVQDEIAAAIGDALQVQLLGRGGEAVSAESIDPAHYETFLQARFLLRRRSDDAIAGAIDRLEPMVAAEPNFARGMALLAEAYLLQRGLGDLAKRYEIARTLAENALALDPDLASAYMILGSVAGENGDWVGEYRGYKKAIELQPEEPRPHHWLALLYSESGFLQDGFSEINEAVRLEPENANARGWRATLHAATGDYESAIADALLQAKYGNPIGHLQAGSFFLKVGDLQQADAQFQLAEGLGVVEANLLLGLTQTGSPDSAAVLTALNQAQEGDDYDVLQGILALGFWDAYLDYRINNAETGKAVPLHTLVWHRDMAEMRADPRFTQVLENKGIIGLWREIGPPADCRPEGESFTCGHGGQP